MITMVTRYDILAEVSKSLGGQNVHVAATKSHSAEDIYNSSDVPTLVISIFPISFVGRSSNIEGEKAMMDSRWKMLIFTYQIPEILHKELL